MDTQKIKVTIIAYNEEREEYIVVDQQNINTNGFPADVVFAIQGEEALVDDGIIFTNENGDGDKLDEIPTYNRRLGKAQVKVRNVDQAEIGTESWFRLMNAEGKTLSRINEYLNEVIIGHEAELEQKARKLAESEDFEVK